MLLGNLIDDKDIKVVKSAFAVRDREEKVCDSPTRPVDIAYLMYQVDQGRIGEIEFVILEIINNFKFITSRQITQAFNLIYKPQYIEDLTQIKVQNSLKKMMAVNLVSRYYFRSDEGQSKMRVYCLDRYGKYLLNSREIECHWNLTDKSKAVWQIKKVLAGNQLLFSYMSKTSTFESYEINANIAQTARIYCDILIRFNDRFNGGIKVYAFEIIRRGTEWEDKLVKKLQDYKMFYESMIGNISVTLPQLVIVGEDDPHVASAFKLIARNNLKPVNAEYYFTTDLRILDESLVNSLMVFRHKEQENKYNLVLLNNIIFN